MIMLTSLLKSFVLCGAVCAAFQALTMCMKLDIMKTLSIAFVLGALLQAAGVLQIMGSWGAGLNVFILGAGGMVCSGALLGAAGNIAGWMGMLGSFLLITALVLLMGVLAALARLKLYPQEERGGLQEVESSGAVRDAQ